jgi:hypothetical protein
MEKEQWLLGPVEPGAEPVGTVTKVGERWLLGPVGTVTKVGEQWLLGPVDSVESVEEPELVGTAAHQVKMYYSFD